MRWLAFRKGKRLHLLGPQQTSFGCGRATVSQERGLFGGVLPEVQAFVKPVLPGLFKPIRNSWPVLVPTLGVAPQRRVRTRQIMGNLAITGLQLALLLNRKNARREWKCVVR